MQRRTFPWTDPYVVHYIEGLIDDEEEEVDDIVDMTRGMLQGGPSIKADTPLDDL